MIFSLLFSLSSTYSFQSGSHSGVGVYAHIYIYIYTVWIIMSGVCVVSLIEERGGSVWWCFGLTSRHSGAASVKNMTLFFFFGG